MQLTTILLAAVALTGSCSSAGEWQADDGKKYYFNANEGCRNPKISPAKWVCFDWKNKRAHWDPSNGSSKRCFKKMRADFDKGDCADSRYRCSRQWWDPHACNW
ncbi:hypothetical protein DE146DRAFT_627919 [Phaeosphaeria sp. MPI-PUGE-AT-0046c]|nr:hypothetical protein DE146DRAFT_627919 [Phaeosphaeria sp. MPI-PUGE-AT-0046c]